MGRNVGALGEVLLSEMAAQEDLTINKAGQDKTGWDFLLEAPLQIDSQAAPLDLLPVPLTCRVQVKSTDRRITAVPIKLDNCLRLVQAADPAFILVFSYNGQYRPEVAYLVHVDDIFITRTLKRLRELSNLSQPQLHKHTLSIPFGSHQALPAITGAALIAEIQRYVGANPSNYIRSKIDRIATVGFESGSRLMRGTIEVPANTDPHEQLVDFLLGLTPTLSVKDLAILKTRFGIVSETPDEIHDVVEIQVVNRTTFKGLLQIGENGSNEVVTWQTDVIFPGGLPEHFDPKYHKVRFSLPFVDILFWVSQPRWQVNFNFPSREERHPLTDFKRAADVISVLNNMFISGIKKTVSAFVAGDLIIQGVFRIDTEIPSGAVLILEIFQKVWSIARFFDLEQELSISEADVVNQVDQINAIATVLTPGTPAIEFGFELDNNLQNLSVAAPFVIPLKLGTQMVMLGVIIYGQARDSIPPPSTGFRYDIEGARLRVAGHAITQGDAADMQVRYSQFRDSIVKRIEEEQPDVSVIVSS